MTTTTSPTADFVQFLESNEDPGNLFAHDLFCGGAELAPDDARGFEWAANLVDLLVGIDDSGP